MALDIDQSCQLFIDTCQAALYYRLVIRSFRHRGLRDFWETGSSRRVDAKLSARIERRLFALNQAKRPEDMNIPGFDFHRLQGKPIRYTVHVNGPWCITFEWDETDAVRVDLEQYH
jgi:toxin HigB-1